MGHTSLIDSLKTSLVIKDKVFAFYLGDSDEYSYFDLGHIDEAAMLDYTKMRN